MAVQRRRGSLEAGEGLVEGEVVVRRSHVCAVDEIYCLYTPR